MEIIGVLHWILLDVRSKLHTLAVIDRVVASEPGIARGEDGQGVAASRRRSWGAAILTLTIHGGRLDVRLLFVCTGNICRSPTAERLTPSLRHRARPQRG